MCKLQDDASLYKSNAFKVAYVLGVKDDVLRRCFEEDYIFSGYTEKFKALEGVSYLRSLCKIRQVLFKYYSQYKMSNGNYSSDVKALTGAYIEEHLDVLEENGLSLYKFIDENHVCGCINELSRRIDSIVYKVLGELGVVHKEYIGVLFKYPTFDKKNIITYITKIKSKENYPHGIIVFNTSKIEDYLGYVLFNDRNLFLSCYRLRGVFYSYESDEELINYYSDYVRVKTDVVDDSNAADIEEVIENSPFKVLKGFVKEHVEEVDKPDKKYYLSKLLDKAYRLTYIYVDCDNIEYFKFLALLKELSRADIDFVVKLFKDVKSSTLWDNIPITSSNLKIESVTVDRIINLKSMVDMVITTSICKDVYQKGVSSIYLVSSDSDFLGLINSVEIKDLGVIYNANQMNSDYLEILSQKEDVLLADIDLLDTTEVSELYKEYSIKHMFLKHIQSVSLSKWSMNDCLDYILRALNNACIGDLRLDEIKRIVEGIKNNLNITLTDEGFKVTLND